MRKIVSFPATLHYTGNTEPPLREHGMFRTLLIFFVSLSLVLDIFLISMYRYTTRINGEIKAERDAAAFEADQCAIELMNERAR